MERFAGTGVLQDGPEERPALETDLIRPTALLATPDGGLISPTWGACRIRKVEPSGIWLDVLAAGSQDAQPARCMMMPC